MNQPHSSRLKRCLFILMMAATPVLLIVLLELGLRLFNYGGDLDLFVLDKSSANHEYVLNSNFTRRYFFQKGIKTPVPISQRFSARKEDSTYRIFCLGASTTQGFPYTPNGAFPAQLKNILSTLHPEVNIEVVNCGITAITSYSVLDIEREILKKYKPDLLVIYAGHNEFYGVFGQASRLSLFESEAMMRTFLKMQRYKLVLLIRNFITTIFTKSFTREAVQGHTTLMGILAKSNDIPYDSPLFHRAEWQFKSNMEKMIREAKERHVDLIVCNLISNLADQPPFSLLLGQDETVKTQNKHLSDLIVEAEKGRSSGRYRDAITFYLQALAQDSTRAEIHYWLGKSYAALPDFDKARHHFQLANDYDTIRFRAPLSFNRIIRELSEIYDVPLADVEKDFCEASPIGIPGSERIMEHVHPNIRGYLLIAKCIARTMSKNNIMSGLWDWNREIQDSLYLAMTMLTPLDYEAANFKVFHLTSRWPFTNVDSLRVYRRIGDEQTERMVRSMIEEEKGNIVQMHLDLGKDYYLNDEPDRGLAEYKAALAIEPIGDIYNRIAAEYIKRTENDYRITKDFAGALQNYNEAHFYIQKGLERYPDNLELNFNLGLLFMMRNDKFKEAYTCFEKVLRLDPLHIESKRMMIRLLLFTNEYVTARKILLRFVKRHPDDVEFQTDLGYVYFKLDDYHDAEKWLEKALSLNPNQARASRLLEQIRIKRNEQKRK